MIRLKPLVVNLLLSLGTGGAAALLTMGSMDTYKTLVKPPLSPPGWVFPIVWTILFILMGISAYLIYVNGESDKAARNTALGLYAAQLALNFIWTIVFFKFEAYGAALIILILLWLAVIGMLLAFRRVGSAAAYLQLPYLLWVTFAGYLNCAIWLLNK